MDALKNSLCLFLISFVLADVSSKSWIKMFSDKKLDRKLTHFTIYGFLIYPESTNLDIREKEDG
jgi:DTW domain-containing protein YfiP